MRITVECPRKDKHPPILAALTNSGKYVYVGADPQSRCANLMFEAEEGLDKNMSIFVAMGIIRKVPDSFMWAYRVVLSDDHFYYPRRK